MSIQTRKVFSNSAGRSKIWSAVFLLILIFSIVIGRYFIFWSNSDYNFEKIVEIYEIDSAPQKEAFKDLLVLSSIMPKNKSWEEAFPKDENIANILKLVSQTQMKFSARYGRERWEVGEIPWIADNETKILDDLRILGFVDEIKPKFKKFDAVCVLGAAKKSMTFRMNYLCELIANKIISTSRVILVSGERYVTEGVDGTAEELQQISDFFKISDRKKLTEARLLEYLYAQSPLNENKTIEKIVIDTPAGLLPRPTTKTTLEDLKKWLRKHQEVKKILFISNQPYVLYQKEVILSILDSQSKMNWKKLKIDVAGPAVQFSPFPRAQAIVEGLGAYIWAKSPSVIKKIIEE